MTETDRQHDRVSYDGGNRPWRDRETMMQKLEDDYTYAELGGLWGVSESTINTWVKRHKADKLLEQVDVEIPDKFPWRDEEVLKTLYVEQQMSISDIGAIMDCSNTTISNWLDKHGIEKRSASESISVASGGKTELYFFTDEQRGYERIKSNDDMVTHHRLQAVAYHGFDALRDQVVHHVNNIKWDNREENLELMDGGTHTRRHQGDYTWLDELRAIEMYKSGASTYDVADVIGCAPETVRYWLNNHDEGMLRNHGGAA